MGSFAIHNALEGLMVATLAGYFLCVGGVDAVLVRRAARYIQKQHPDAWRKLSINSPYNLTFRMYVRNRNYLALRDSTLTAMFDFKRRFDTYTFVAFAAVIAALYLLNRYYR